MSLKDAAEKYALECEKRNWIYCVRDAFLEGASFERQRILGLLRDQRNRNEKIPGTYFVVGEQLMNGDGWADYLEKELNENPSL